MLTATSATFGYGRQAVVREIDFTIERGQVTAVLGPNGAGKSTLVKTVLGLQSLLGGRMSWRLPRPKPISYLAQLTEFDRSFPMSARDLVASGKLRAGRAAVQAALEAVQLADRGHLPVHELSSGQLQRVRFARTILQDAGLIILDEPFAAVDQRREADMLKLIAAWAQQGRAVVLVLHCLSAALKYCANSLLLGAGGGDFGPTREILKPQNLIARGYMSQDQIDVMQEAAHA